MSSTPSVFIYLDNAATTRIDPWVVEAMQPYLTTIYGNPSSSHRLGTSAKVAIERARRAFMEGLSAWDGHIFFTSGGTEANNCAIRGLIAANAIEQVITSPVEHSSVLQPLHDLAARGIIKLHLVALDRLGQISYDSLAALLAQYPRSLVTLMHGNNELGNLTDIQQVSNLCRAHHALFHSDMVQTAGYEGIDLSALPVDACTIAPHKFHGPKGVGVLYIRNNVNIQPLSTGGTQERGLRPGTENIAAIVGGAKAFEIACATRQKNYGYVAALKKYMIEQLRNKIPDILFHGDLEPGKSVPSILHIGLDLPGHYETLALNFDIQGVAVSAGSACMSGTNAQSHVLQAIGVPPTRPVTRFSFSKYTTQEELDAVVDKMKNFLG